MAGYQVLRQVEHVLVKVPKKSLYMQQMDAHSFESATGPVSVPTHWRNGQVFEAVNPENRLILTRNECGEDVPKKLILTRIFYGITEADLGRTAMFTVKVIKKTTDEGREFVLLDFIKEEAGVGLVELKFLDERSDLPIIGTKVFIHFRERKR